MSGDDAARDAGPEATFALLGNETRAAILQALGSAGGRDRARATLSFSELRERVAEWQTEAEGRRGREADAAGVDSSQFNYHLQQLVGVFVQHVDEGYRLHPAGMRLYRTIVAGTFTRQPSVGPFGVGLDCFFCDAPVEATYENGRFGVRCSGCGHEYALAIVPPSAVAGDDEDAILRRFDQFNRKKLLAFGRGVCPTCAHALDTELIPASDAPLAGAAELDVFVHRPCDYCGKQPHVSLGLALLYDPDLVAFCREHGVDVTSTPVWELEFAMTDRYTTVRSRNPWEVGLALELDGDTLELVVDGDLNVVERQRP